MSSLAKLIGYLAIAGFIIVYGSRSCSAYLEELRGGETKAVSSASCVPLHVDVYPDSYFVNDKLDYGFTVRTKIKNVGERGDLHIRASLSTSEGNFERSQYLQFQPKEELDLKYQFPEPSINATSVQGSIRCTP